MGKYDGASRYTNHLTDKEELFCQYLIKDKLPQNQAYIKAYPECATCTPVTIASKVQKINSKEKIIKRVAELQQLELIKNQSQDEYFNFLKKSPKEFVLMELYKVIESCKIADDRPNTLKAIESIAKIFNLYNEAQTNTTFNTQLNNIVIKSKDLNEAISNIKSLVNKQL